MHAILQSLRRLFIGITLVYVVGMAGLALLWNGETPEVWWLELPNIFAPYLFVPLLLLVPAALFIRSRWFRGAVFCLSAIFGLLFVPTWIPSNLFRPALEPNLRVATWNVLYNNPEGDEVVALLRAQDADVIVLQELTVPVTEVLEEQMRPDYPYQALEPLYGARGMGIISRYPFVNRTNDPTVPWRRVTLEVADQELTVINVHLATPELQTRDLPFLNREVIIEDYTTARRSTQQAELLALIDSIEGPLVVLGDFNTSDREPAYAELNRRLHDAYRETAWGAGLTFPQNVSVGPLPVPFPLVRIDYVWSKGGILPTDAYTVCRGGGSDHCMVVADMAMAEISVAGE
jgi:endonuclease/exonuclease/phosphatase (EEP) superfamily protein YafD